MGTDVKIPIKRILEESMLKNHASYEEDEFNLLRKYFIACLNGRYFEPEDLSVMVNRFTEKIKSICTECKVSYLLDDCAIDICTLYVDCDLKRENPMLYEINFYKAVTEVLFRIPDADSDSIFSCALTEIVAESLYNIDTNGSPIIMPNLSFENIGDTILELRAGYEKYNLPITCIKQLFVCRKINDRILIREIFLRGYNYAISKLYENQLNFEKSKELVSLLEDMFQMYIERVSSNIFDSQELETLRVYQRYLNKIFPKQNIGEYFTFLALVTEDSLRNEFIENIDS